MNRDHVRTMGVVLLGGLFACVAPHQSGRQNGSPDAVNTRLDDAASAFQGELRSVLLREMQKGTTQAVSVCSDSAQRITATIGRRLGVSIRRTSERFRNPANAPTEHDLRVLERFSHQLAEGAKLDTLEVFEELDVNGVSLWRLSKPIPLSSSACLKCHGSESEVSPQLWEFLNARYPGDRAQGYAVGDLRGMVVVSEITPEN